MTDYTMVIDQGGQSTRAIVFDHNGSPITITSEALDDAPPHSNGHIEFAIKPILDSTVLVLDRLSQKLTHKQLNKLGSVSIIVQRSSLIACNKQGDALTEMISWQDTRNSHWLERQTINHDEYQQLTGLRCNPHMGASKIRWLLDNHPTVQEHARKNDLIFMPWGAYFLFKLKQYFVEINPNVKNELICDGVLAARTGLCEYGQLNWSKKLMSMFAISEKYLPKLYPTSYQYGSIKLAKRTIPIKLLGGDQSFIPCSFGLDQINNSIFLNIGTGAFMQSQCMSKDQQGLLKTAIAIETTNPEDLSYKENKQVDALPQDCFPIIEGTVNAAASLLEWWQSQLNQQYSHSEIDYFLKNIQQAPIFITTRFGTGSPYWLSSDESKDENMHEDKFNSGFINHDKQSTNEEKTVAVIESIIFSCKINIDRMIEQNPSLTKIIISGGLAKSDQICQKLSDLLALPIERADDNEASARGAVFYLHKKNKYKPSQPSTVFTPNENNLIRSSLRKRFDLYLSAIEALYYRGKI